VNYKEDADLMVRAAKAARLRPAYLGHALAQYEDLEETDEDALRDQLGVAKANWSRLQLCLRPRPDSFLKDVTAIAQEFNIDRAALVSVIRRVDAAKKLQGKGRPRSAGALLAARTRKKKPTSPPPNGPEEERHES
jgi:hypothetical protein